MHLIQAVAGTVEPKLMVLRKAAGFGFPRPGNIPVKVWDCLLYTSMCHLHLELCTPSGAAVLHAFAVFLGVLAFAVHHEPQRRSTGDADQQVKGVEAGGGIGKGRRAAVRKVQELLGKVNALRQPVRLPQLAEQIDNCLLYTSRCV